ncbi:MAG: hypothetical protein JXB04_13645 [Kiritimatiellae bacterium]|nr:hypothetical protein [Kiritimatiellia bacterium]
MKKAVCFVGMVVLTVRAFAGSIDIFRASVAGADAWQWGGARIQEKRGAFVITEHNKQADYGDVFVADRLPLFQDASVELDVREVSGGSYSLQVLGFKDDLHLASADVIKNSAETGGQIVSMKSIGFVDEIETVVFKIWVAGEGASVVIGDLVYVLPLDDEKVISDERFTKVDGWEADGALLSAAREGGILTLAPGRTYGSILLPDRRDKDTGLTLLLDLPKITDGRVTVQLVQFDELGDYLESADILKDVGPGFHSIPLEEVKWHPQAEQYMIKFWLSGTVAAEAVLRRLVLMRP